MKAIIIKTEDGFNGKGGKIGKLALVKCNQCNKEWWIQYSRVKNGAGKHCSEKCYIEYQKTIPSNYNNIPEVGKKISKAKKGKKRPPFSKEWKEKMSKSRIGEKHWNWQGGKSFEPYSTNWTETLRRSIRERDNYICQLCSQYGNTVHHIDYNKQNCDPSNLITLCNPCNTRVNKNRDYWTNYFKKYIAKFL